MIRTMSAIGLLVAMLAGPVSAADGNWVRVTTGGGQAVSLASFGFYRGPSWDCIAKFHVDRGRVEVLYGGVRTRIPLDKIRAVTLDDPVFTESFGAAVIELEDGTRFRCGIVPEVIGVAGEDQIGKVCVPGHQIRKIEFVRPESKSSKPAREESGES